MSCSLACVRFGFSLIELMVSMAVGGVVLLVAAALLGLSGDGYEKIGGGVSAEREARAVMGQLASDLSTACFHKDGVIEGSALAWPVDRLGFLCLQSADAQSDEGRIGDLCAVGYYVGDLTIRGKVVRCLMRGFRESDETFVALGEEDVPSLFAERAGIDEPLAFGVVSFEARPKQRDGSGKWIDWVKEEEVGPEALDVRLVVARRGLAARLKNAGDWDGSGELGEPSDVERHPDLEIFETMIRFGNHERE